MWRLFLVCLLFLLSAPGVNSAKAQDPINIERADVATGLFKKACFINFGKKEKTQEFLNSTFHKHDDTKKQLFLDFTKTDKGDVWIASFPKGMFAIVLADNGNCHVIAQKADRGRVHANIEKLADEAENNLAFNIKKHAINSGLATKSNGFDVIGTSGQNLIVVVASSPLEQEANKPDAIITMAVEAY